MRELGTETQEAQPETEPETDAFQLMNDHELIVTNNNNNSNVETETTRLPLTNSIYSTSIPRDAVRSSCQTARKA